MFLIRISCTKKKLWRVHAFKNMLKQMLSHKTKKLPFLRPTFSCIESGFQLLCFFNYVKLIQLQNRAILSNRGSDRPPILKLLSMERVGMALYYNLRLRNVKVIMMVDCK